MNFSVPTRISAARCLFLSVRTTFFSVSTRKLPLGKRKQILRCNVGLAVAKLFYAFRRLVF